MSKRRTVSRALGLEWLGWQVYVMYLGKASPKDDLLVSTSMPTRLTCQNQEMEHPKHKNIKNQDLKQADKEQKEAQTAEMP